jgi:hypothetical protein
VKLREVQKRGSLRDGLTAAVRAMFATSFTQQIGDIVPEGHIRVSA